MDETKPPYQLKVSYVFQPRGARWEITEWSEKFIEFEDMRKNGQEDTHVHGWVEKVDGTWVWAVSGEFDEEHPGGSQVKEYMGQRTADELLAYFNEHGAPPVEGQE